MGVAHLIRQIKRAMRGYEKLMLEFLKPWQINHIFKQSGNRLAPFVLCLNACQRTNKELLHTFVSLFLQKQGWIISIRGRQFQTLPWLMRHSRHVTSGITVVNQNSYIGLLPAGAWLHPCALTCFRKALEDDNDIVFSDQIVRKKRHISQRFLLRLGYSPDYMRSSNYLGDVLFFRAKLLTDDEQQKLLPGNMTTYEILLQLSRRTERFSRLPMFLYRSENTSNEEENKKALQHDLQNLFPGSHVKTSAIPGIHRICYPLPENAKISIIIPNRNHSDDLRKCIDSIRSQSSWKNHEILIVENGSTEPALKIYYDELQRSEYARILVWNKPYNFSAICNYAAKQAEGQYLLFLNNDVEVLSPEWMEEMLMYAQRADVGAVGAKLLYPDGTVQHGGILMGVGGIAGHAYKHLQADDPRNMGHLQSVHNCSAVTGACLMIDKQRYLNLDGMDEALAVAYNDVDLCLRLRRAGFLNVYTPYAVLYHYESKTRGEESGDRAGGFAQETALMRQHWKEQLEMCDPYHHPFYSPYDEQYTMP